MNGSDFRCRGRLELGHVMIFVVAAVQLLQYPLWRHLDYGDNRAASAGGDNDDDNGDSEERRRRRQCVANREDGG